MVHKRSIAHSDTSESEKFAEGFHVGPNELSLDRVSLFDFVLSRGRDRGSTSRYWPILDATSAIAL